MVSLTHEIIILMFFSDSAPMIDSAFSLESERKKKLAMQQKLLRSFRQFILEWMKTNFDPQFDLPIIFTVT